MGKKSDKNYITYSEWASDFGGAKAAATALRGQQANQEFKRLPFYCCNLSLKPVEVPVCTLQGELFDFIQIIPYLRKHGNRHPLSGSELRPADLIKLTLHRNENGEYFCPITRKTLGPNSKIVANRRGGHVYAWETVQNLNIDKSNWKDLMTDEEFTRDDLIILQDPANPRNYSKSFEKAQEEQRLANSEKASGVNMSGGVGRVLKELKMTEIQPIRSDSDEGASSKNLSVDELHAQAPHSTGRMAASLTSTSMSLRTETEMAILDEAETLARLFPAGKDTNASICIRTNFGDLFFTLFASKAPRSTFNFIQLAKKGYYDGVSFHRLVKGFVLQGGDPGGDGRGGQSCWGKPFGERSLHPSLSHNERGILSMANAGDVNANSSQFFITLRPAPHLNGKHPIFGKLLAGGAVLDKIEEEVEVDAEGGHVPLTKIIMEDVLVLEDPFEEAQKLVTNTQIVNNRKPQPTKTPASKSSGPPQIGKYLVMKNRK